MTRPIKFRAWNHNAMEYITDLYWFEENQIHNQDDCPLMQFTGLLDKQGMEIYEGDIVKYCHWNDCDTNKERKWKIGEIIWDNMEYRFCIRPKEAMNSLYSSKMYEIIGNIYESKELLHE